MLSVGHCTMELFMFFWTSVVYMCVCIWEGGGRVKFPALLTEDIMILNVFLVFHLLVCLFL